MARFKSLTRNPKPETRNFISSVALLTLFLAGPILAATLQVPALHGRVNDYAGLMPPERARALDERLARFEQETGHQIAVLTIPSLGGEPLENFSIKVAENWKIGQKGFDNGVILLIARDDRKIRIEVGYGLEGALPDAIASRIIREIILPRFRADDYAGGIEAGVEAIFKVTRGEPLPARPAQPKSVSFSLAQLFFILLLAAIPIIAILGTQNQNRAASAWSGRRRYGGWGGPFGGGFGGGGSGGGGGFGGGGGGFGGGGASGGW